MKVADYIAEFLADRGISEIFAISGASNIRILDAIHRHPRLSYICPHHEQAGVMAAVTYYRLSGRLGVMTCTAGPGATNTVTGVADAYLDSIPCLVLAGQEKSEFMDPANLLRGKGVQGLDMVSVIAPLTKYAVCVREARDIRYHLERAWHEAFAGRPGPVWVEVPQDVQAVDVDPASLRSFVPEPPPPADELRSAARATLALLQQAKRPLLWAGHAIRLSGCVPLFTELVDRLQAPTLLSWQAADLLPGDHPLYVGRAGTYGQRAANFALQNCDLLVCLGTRLAIPQRGYSEQEFARAARKVVVEIDPAEIAKFRLRPDVVAQGDVGVFLAALRDALPAGGRSPGFPEWLAKCREWIERYPLCPPDLRRTPKGEVNSYHFVDRLSDHLAADEVICTDMGTSLTCTHATIRLKKGQRLVTSTGLGEMGFGLPGAIGACFGAGRRRTVFIGTEGSLMMNLQELHTVVAHRLPMKIFILNNNSYLTIKHTERAIFGERLSGCSPDTGVSFPDLKKVSEAFGFTHFRIDDPASLDELIPRCLAADGPVFCEVIMPQDQFLGPKSAVKVRPDGSLYSPPLEDLAPFLPREELAGNMLIPLLPEG